MAKGPYLTHRIKKLIANIYIADHQIKPAKARELLLKRMKKEQLDQIFGSNFPSVSTVSKELKELRDKDESRSTESKGLDQPWTLLSLTEYPIAPEALPAVMRIWAQTTGGEPLTVREALWIGRLYYIAQEDDDLLALLAETYTKADILEELMKDILPMTDRKSTRWAMLLQNCTTYLLTTGDRKPYKTVLERWKKADPELFQLLMEWEPSNGIESLHVGDLRTHLEQIRHRHAGKPKKEAQNERKRKTKKQK